MHKPHWYYLMSVIIAVTVAVYERNTSQTQFTISYEDAILINDGAIKRVDYLTAVTMMEDEKQHAMQAVDYQLIVDRLSEEELLFQHGLEKGVIYHPEISQVIVSNILETIVVQHTSEKYSNEKLLKIYQEKILTHYQATNADNSVPDEMSFEQIKEDLAAALREIERSKTVRKYIDWLRKRSDISPAKISRQEN